MLKGKPFMTTGALFMGLIVVLGAIGIVNGLWSKNLVIHGVVETGDLNADWDCGYSNDDGTTSIQALPGKCLTVVEDPDDGLDPAPGDADFVGAPGFVYSTPFFPKNVARCDLDIDPADDNPDFGAQVASVTIWNAYPSYECTLVLYLSNTGSIPFNIAGSELVLPANVGIETLTQVCVADACEVVSNATNACTFDVTDPQVDPGEERALECTVHVLQTAEQNDCANWTTAPGPVINPPAGAARCIGPDGGALVVYTFDIQVCVAQWNETATFDNCKGSLQHEGPPDLAQ